MENLSKQSAEEKTNKPEEVSPEVLDNTGDIKSKPKRSSKKVTAAKPADLTEHSKDQDNKSLPVQISKKPTESDSSVDSANADNPVTEGVVVDAMVDESKKDDEAEKKNAKKEATPEMPAKPTTEESEVIVTGPSQKDDNSHDTSDDEHHEESDDDDDDDSEDDTVNYATFSKEDLVKELENTVKEEHVTRFKTKIGKIRIAYNDLIKTEKEEQRSLQIDDEEEPTKDANAPMQVDALSLRFNTAFDLYKEKKNRLIQALEEQKHVNLQKKHEILENLRALINSDEPLKKTYDEFKRLQDEWKEIGMVPKNETSELWKNYHFLIEKFFDKVKINKELRDLDLKKNMEMKIELCEKAEELLLLEISVLKSFRQLQKYHQEWKDIGPVPADKNDELWERFKTVTEKINERRKEYYEQLHQEQQNNLVAKTALCEKAEELMALPNNRINDWQKRTEELNELLKIWKSLGPAPRKHNDEIWNRFKGTLDEFYNNKKEYFNALKNEQINNLNLKLDICSQAEAIQESNNWKETTNELINLQKKWKEIGPVPRKNSDKIWKRFRAACDHFFKRKEAYFGNIKQHEEDNLKKKEAIIEKIENYSFGDNQKENLNILKDLQREFLEIGHVPMKSKNEVQQNFRKTINAQLDKLKISPAELSAMSYKARLENVVGTPRAEQLVNKEKHIFANKISKLKNDINLWENNLGFFANSAKAEVLKEEFEKKIDKAKEELAILEAKMNIIHTELNKAKK